ncbi:hypothetical protein BKA69DRAFT_1087905 [Paraphysoderma sedebokerense]|nr:hypothetical protein BKA69DRAFT_1095364 [Paraphysoderma sedebokerense]KAI9137895.1 hypothetical protein BKA69DRAFT_1095228 [Paraphysoderma sedebokerense]KAI9137903.1 hypothetical protein BKA69DRAFT_1095294 [Paraphysoderma sedebokerense]KAI9139023.1 hypothetical protein BKA69DRAFT_1087905 [Paraphysoderma sedebokerense]
MACVGNQTFELILRQPVLLHHFQIYLSKSLAEENLVFLKTLREVKSSSLELSDPVAIRNDIQKLIEEFFLPSSPMELNIPSSLRKRLLTEIEELEVFEPHSFAIFEEAEKHIIGVLNNRVKTFYRDYMKQSSETLIPALKSSQKRVVVLGGGFCGALLASILDKMPRFNVCLIDSKTFFEYTPSVVKEIPNPSTVDNIRIPHSEIVQNGHFVLGYVDSVTPHHVSLGNVEIPFDYLAIATGSTYASHIKAANISSTYRSKKLSYEHQRLVKSRNVLIVGGGGSSFVFRPTTIRC